MYCKHCFALVLLDFLFVFIFLNFVLRLSIFCDCFHSILTMFIYVIFFICLSLLLPQFYQYSRTLAWRLRPISFFVNILSIYLLTYLPIYLFIRHFLSTFIYISIIHVARSPLIHILSPSWASLF